MKTVVVSDIKWPVPNPNMPESLTIQLDDDMDPKTAMPSILKEGFGMEAKSFVLTTDADVEGTKVQDGSTLPT